MDGFRRNAFPQEIWWLVTQELASRYDFSGLFLCARLSWSMARLALPLLYSIHDESPAAVADEFDSSFEASVCLWRSIIASSLGATLYPYCCWSKTLMFDSLHFCLECLAGDDNSRLRARLFSPPLEKFQIRRGGTLDLDAIVAKMTGSVMDCIRRFADEEDRHAGLEALHCSDLSAAMLPSWVSKLFHLTSLSVPDGSVLTAEVARAIRAHCPAFSEVRCLRCEGTDADEKLAGFFRGLAPHTLEYFDIASQNDIGGKSFKALRKHSRSLKTLLLSSLEQPALQSLNELGDCLALESLELVASWNARHYPWETECEEVFLQVKQWLQKCISLRELKLCIPGLTTLLAEVLKTPTVRLKSLSAILSEPSSSFYASLAHQRQLRKLHIMCQDWNRTIDENRHARLSDVISSCHELREFGTDELLTDQDIEHISNSLPFLEIIHLHNGIDDDLLVPLSRLSRLKSLNVHGLSCISADALLEFFERMEADPAGSHEGMDIIISGQLLKWSDEEKMRVTRMIRNRFKGEFEIWDS